MAQQSSLSSAMKSVWEAGNTSFSDMTLVCQGHGFPVHRIVVCSQSPVLATAMRGPFREATSGIYTIQDQDIDTVRCMVQWLYTSDYQVNSTGDAPSNEAQSTTGAESSTTNQVIESDAQDRNWLPHLKIAAVANLYEITELETDAARKMTTALLEPTGLSQPSRMKNFIEYLSGEGVHLTESDVLCKEIAKALVPDCTTRYKDMILASSVPAQLLAQIARCAADVYERYEWKDDHIWDCVDSLNSLARCNYCSTEFKCRLELRYLWDDAETQSLSMRCIACNLRHDGSILDTRPRGRDNSHGGD